MLPITTTTKYWCLRENVEIYNIEIKKLLKKLSVTPVCAISSKEVYDLAQIVVNREYIEKLSKAYEENTYSPSKR